MHDRRTIEPRSAPAANTTPQSREYLSHTHERCVVSHTQKCARTPWRRSRCISANASSTVRFPHRLKFCPPRCVCHPKFKLSKSASRSLHTTIVRQRKERAPDQGPRSHEAFEHRHTRTEMVLKIQLVHQPGESAFVVSDARDELELGAAIDVHLIDPVLCFGALCFCVLASPAGRVFCVFVFWPCSPAGCVLCFCVLGPLHGVQGDG